MADSMVEAFKLGLKQLDRERKSDELLHFVINNWSAFCRSKAYMRQLCDELESRGDLSVTSLVDALGVPDNVLFKKVKIAATARALLDIAKSSLVSTFRRLVEERRRPESAEPELCLVAVAGDHTLVVTNMPVTRKMDAVDICVYGNPARGDIHVFNFADASDRLPHVFGQHR